MNADGHHEQYLKPSEVAAIARVTAAVVSRWIRFGVRIEGRLIKLRAVAFGDGFRVTPDDLDAFKDECTRAKLRQEFDPKPETPRKRARRAAAGKARVAAMLRE